MNAARSVFVLRAALVVGLLIDGVVGLVALAAPALVEPLFDIPVKDPIAVQLAGPEFIVAALVYAAVFIDPRHFRALLWICALDQLFAVVLPVIALARGIFPASFKVIAPIPVSALLVVVFVAGAFRLADAAKRAP